jgi:hypothetical protein
MRIQYLRITGVLPGHIQDFHITRVQQLTRFPIVSKSASESMGGNLAVCNDSQKTKRQLSIPDRPCLEKLRLNTSVVHPNSLF